MSNKLKGEVTLVSGKIMKLDFNALADLEDITGKLAFEVLGDFDTGRISMKDTRALFYVCLKQNHPEITIEEAGREVDLSVIPALFGVSIPEGQAEGNEPKGKTKKT